MFFILVKQVVDWVIEHLNGIKHKRIVKLEVVRHFNSAQHNCDDANVVGLLTL